MKNEKCIYIVTTYLILDAGGGPGRYSIELAKMGYQVVLLDVSPVQLAIAKKKIGKRRKEIRDMVVDIVEGDIVDLSRFDDKSFDSVLCLGPLSHIIDERTRKKAARELIRVLKGKSPIFVSVIGRYGVYKAILKYYPSELTDPHAELEFEKGVHIGHRDPQKRKYRQKDVGFPDAYFFFPEELKGLFEGYRVKTLDMASCEGLSSHMRRETNAIYRDKGKWDKWLKIILETSNDPSILGMGEHLLYVGRKS